MAKLSFQPANCVDKGPFFMFVPPMPAIGPCRPAPTLPRPQPPCFDADAPCSTKQAPAPRETARFGLQDGPYGKPIRHVLHFACNTIDNQIYIKSGKSKCFQNDTMIALSINEGKGGFQFAKNRVKQPIEMHCDTKLILTI